MKRLFPATLALILVTAPALCADELAPKIDEIFADYDSTRTPGCAVALIRDGEIAYKQGYGMANLDHDVPISSSSVFHVASVSKQFTAAAIVLLVLDGKLSLDDDIHEYLP
jgi:CubicO group peptidase (beta-lactamase class C family)